MSSLAMRVTPELFDDLQRTDHSRDRRLRAPIDGLVSSHPPHPGMLTFQSLLLKKLRFSLIFGLVVLCNRLIE